LAITTSRTEAIGRLLDLGLKAEGEQPEKPTATAKKGK
jgi:hypothetical protein